MDGQTLQNIFQSPNFALWGPAEQAFNLDQQKQQANLQSLLGTEQRAQEMQPLDIAHKQAVTRSGNANAATVEDALKAQAPAEERMKLAMKQLHAKSNETDRAQMDADMYDRLQRASVIKANGGQIPLSMQKEIPPEEMPYYTGKGLDLTIAMGKAYHENHPKTIEAREKQAADYRKTIDAAKIMADSRVTAAGMKGSGSGAQNPKTFDAKIIALSQEFDNADSDEEKAAIQGKLQYFQGLKAKAVQDAALARQGGQFDLGAKGIPTTSGAPTPAVPYPGTKPKEEAKQYASPEDVKSAFKSGKITKEQAIQILRKEHGMQ